MPGQIKRIVDSIIQQRAKGNPTLALTTKAKLIFKGLNPDRFTEDSADDPALIAKARTFAAELGVNV
jgi:hypothetical protein